MERTSITSFKYKPKPRELIVKTTQAKIELTINMLTGSWEVGGKLTL
ncbi:MAG: hypothetical protein HQ557_02950 [Bacteroidetes bacterium]|nr:hypothetical protein [Bacteroidota bacterium]